MTKQMKHRCEVRTSAAGHGAAITYCETDDDGALWVGNDEYESAVQFCPYCGFQGAGIDMEPVGK